jgi:hypothetical protein
MLPADEQVEVIEGSELEEEWNKVVGKRRRKKLDKKDTSEFHTDRTKQKLPCGPRSRLAKKIKIRL